MKTTVRLALTLAVALSMTAMVSAFGKKGGHHMPMMPMAAPMMPMMTPMMTMPMMAPMMTMPMMAPAVSTFPMAAGGGMSFSMQMSGDPMLALMFPTLLRGFAERFLGVGGGSMSDAQLRALVERLAPLITTGSSLAGAEPDVRLLAALLGLKPQPQAGMTAEQMRKEMISILKEFVSTFKDDLGAEKLPVPTPKMGILAPSRSPELQQNQAIARSLMAEIQTKQNSWGTPTGVAKTGPATDPQRLLTEIERKQSAWITASRPVKADTRLETQRLLTEIERKQVGWAQPPLKAITVAVSGQ